MSRLLGGGTDGNERLTTVTGALLLVLLAVLGITIVRIGQLIWLHLFLGFILIGPVVLKMTSTGYRFTRYYTSNAAYVRKGPPPTPLRTIAPAVVISTLVVFVSGIWLMFQGPRNRAQLLTLHKVSFIVWLVFTGLHVLGHLPTMAHSMGIATGRADASLTDTGRAGRWIAVASAVVAGLVLAVVLIPHFGAWTAPGVLRHHHGG